MIELYHKANHSIYNSFHIPDDLDNLKIVFKNSNDSTVSIVQIVPINDNM